MIMPIRVGYAQPQGGGQGFARTKKVFSGGNITLVAGDVVLNAQTAIARLPKGFTLQSYTAVIGDCDTGATLMLAIGDAGNNARIAAAAATGQAGGTLNTLATANYEFPADTDILLTATVAAAGLGPTPTINFTCEGYMR
jgi:hypothetical protein